MTLEVSLRETGRHRGDLVVPWSREDSAYGQLRVPVIVLQGGPGPTLLLTAGVHGDEYEGQIALAELARTLDSASLSGRVILVPRLNLPAARAGRRTSPVDGGNLARLFPGQPGGSLTAALAAAVSRHLLPLADVVLDLHAGGRSLDYLPCAWGRLGPDLAQSGRVLDLMLAFGAEVTAVTVQPGTSGTLVAEALSAGRLAFAAELGGGGAVTAASLTLARQGCRRILVAMGMLPATSPAAPGRLLAVEPSHFLRSPAAGLFEPKFTLGQMVRAGEPAGLLHDPERDDEPCPLPSPASGMVICRRVPAACEVGDVLLHLGRETTRDELLGYVR